MLAGGEGILSFIETEADGEFEEVASDTWDAGIYGDHAFIAETNAFLVWYTQDCSRVTKVVEAIELLGQIGMTNPAGVSIFGCRHP